LIYTIYNQFELSSDDIFIPYENLVNQLSISRLMPTISIFIH